VHVLFQSWSVLKNSWLEFNAYLTVSREKATDIFLNLYWYSGCFHCVSLGKNVANNSLKSEKTLGSAT